jgi:hypothetical protein
VGSGLPDHRIGIWLLSAFGYTEKLPVYEAAPWTVRYLASLTELTDKKYAAALADIYGRPRVVIDSLPSGWDPSSIFQVDIAKVLGDTLSKTNPVNVRLSDGTNDIPLPTALDTGAFKVREQNPITGFATAANQIIIQAYIDGIETLLAGGLPAALDTGALKTREQNPITGFATQTTLALIAGYVDGLEALLGGGLPSALATDALKIREQGTPTVTVGTFPDNEPFNLNQVGGTAQTAADWTPLLQKLDAALSTLARLQPWYQTNFAVRRKIYAAGSVAPHNWTTRWTYTVPTSRLAQVASSEVLILRETVGSAAATVNALIIENSANYLLTMTEVAAAVGTPKFVNTGWASLLKAAETLVAQTYDGSTNGTYTYQIMASIMEFNT